LCYESYAKSLNGTRRPIIFKFLICDNLVEVMAFAIVPITQTAAFALPTLERLLFRPKRVPAIRVLILTPTRELAIQYVLFSPTCYFHMRIACFFMRKILVLLLSFR
jgi:hypothetical protein